MSKPLGDSKRLVLSSTRTAARTLARLRPYVQALGVAITIASLIFVVAYLNRIFQDQSLEVLSTDNLFLVLICAGFYAATLGILALAWVNLVNGVSRTALGQLDGLCIYAVSQVFKYLPSNVLHAVGRYAMTKARGQSHRAVLFAQASEMLLISLAAVTVVAALGLRMIEEQYVGFATKLGWRAVVMAMVIMVTLVGLLAYAIFGHRRVAVRISISYLMFVAFFVITGLIAAGLLYGVSGNSVTPHTLHIVAAVAAAWLGGWLTPGAPAGIGVRESLIIFFLSPYVGAEASAFLAVAYRVVTTLGDLLFALIGLAVAYVTRRSAVFLLATGRLRH